MQILESFERARGTLLVFDSVLGFFVGYTIVIDCARRIGF